MVLTRLANFTVFCGLHVALSDTRFPIKDADGHGHGTHTAGTAVGAFYGVATGAKVIAVKVLGDSSEFRLHFYLSTPLSCILKHGVTHLSLFYQTLALFPMSLQALLGLWTLPRLRVVPV